MSAQRLYCTVYCNIHVKGWSFKKKIMYVVDIFFDNEGRRLRLKAKRLLHILTREIKSKRDSKSCPVSFEMPRHIVHEGAVL